MLALNIFHHFLREKELYFKLIKFLKNLNVKEMYFQPHDPNETLMANAYVNYDSHQFVDFILKNSCLNNFEIVVEKIGIKNRPIFKLLK